jgi:hypothetical protein
MIDREEHELAGAPPAGRHDVVVAGVTLTIRQAGDRGYELLLQTARGHLWRPRALWLRSNLMGPAIVKRDLDNVLVPLLRAVAAPGALTEAEAADAMIGLRFTATLDDNGNVLAAEVTGVPIP